MLTAAVAMFVLTPAQAASFRCSGAETADERAVCADPRLSDLDSLLGDAYAEAKEAGGGEDVRTLARDFLADRRTCAADASCILGTYVAVLRQLSSYGTRTSLPDDVTAETIAAGKARVSTGLPTRVGRCVITEVSGVHPRLGDGGAFTDEDFNSGTGIEFRNDGYQVSYDREEALIGSRPGDEVVMCLVSIPHDCPPGDDRGRMYTVTNKRTGETWTLPDSQHMCGGA